MQDIFDFLSWDNGFQKDKDMNHASQKLSFLSDQQKKSLKADFEKNPFLFLMFDAKMLNELKKLEFDIVVDLDDQNRIWALNENDWLKKYDEMANSSNDYFDSVTGDGYCQTYATMQAFGCDSKTITKDNAQKIRKELAEAIALDFFKKKGFDFKSFDEIPENFLNDPKYKGGLEYYRDLLGLNGTVWLDSARLVKYFSKKNKRPAWDINLNKYKDNETCGLYIGMFGGADFQDILYDCPVVVLNSNHNHFVNLTTDKAKRKNFAIKFFDIFSDNYIAYTLLNSRIDFTCDSGGCKELGPFGYFCVWANSFYEEVIPNFLSLLFKKIEKREVITQLENFFKVVPHNYKNMAAIKLMLYIFDKYKTKILEPFDINTPENKFMSANEFLSDVLVDLKNDLSIKYPDLKKVFNHESKERPEENKTEIEKPPESEKISDNPEPEPLTNQTNQKSEINEQKNDQEIYKPEENNKKDEIKTKDKPKSKKKIFSGPKWLYILLCIITLSIFYFFRSSPETKKDKPLLTKEDKTQNKDDKEKSETDETKEPVPQESDSKAKPLFNLNSLKNDRPDKKVKSTQNQSDKNQR